MNRDIWKWRVTWIASSVALVLLGASAGREWLRARSLGAEMEALELERATLTEQVAHLESLAQYAQSDAFLEEQARESFGLAKPGESVAVIPYNTPVTPTAPSTKIPRWKEWAQWLSGDGRASRIF